MYTAEKDVITSKFDGKYCIFSANARFYMWDQMNHLKIYYLKIQVLLHLWTFRNMNKLTLTSSSVFYTFGPTLEPIWNFGNGQKNLLPTATNQTVIPQLSSLQTNNYTHYTSPVPVSLWVHMHNSINHQHAPLQILCKDSSCLKLAKMNKSSNWSFTTGLINLVCGAGKFANFVCMHATWNSTHKMKNDIHIHINYM